MLHFLTKTNRTESAIFNAVNWLAFDQNLIFAIKTIIAISNIFKINHKFATPVSAKLTVLRDVVNRGINKSKIY